MITLGNHALRSYMTWLLVTLTWLPVTLTWLLYNLQVWRHGRWFRKFTVRFRPIIKELESSMYNNIKNINEPPEKTFRKVLPLVYSILPWNSWGQLVASLPPEVFQTLSRQHVTIGLNTAFRLPMSLGKTLPVLSRNGAIFQKRYQH